MIRRARRATLRTIRRMTRRLRLRLIDWRIYRSMSELERLRIMHRDFARLEQIEFQQQSSLFVRRMTIEREL